MNRTKIEWCDYTWNPIVGCKRGCPYCYARKIHNRFNPSIPFEKITRFEDRLSQPLTLRKLSRIFVGSMSDIEYWTSMDMYKVLNIVKARPQHTFLFLTKNGEVYNRQEFPNNCWLGVTSVNGKYKFVIKKENRHNIKFLSIEPLLMKWTGLWLSSQIDWIIIGGLSPKPVHKKEWIDSMCKEADRLKIPIFIKQNTNYPKIRQEFPVNTSTPKE